MPAAAGVVLGDRDEQERDEQADQGRAVEVPEVELAAAVKRHRDRDEADRGEDRRDDNALVESVDDAVRALAHPGEPGADDRRENRDGAETQRVEPQAGRVEVCAEQHDRDCRDRIGLEQVGCHAGAVADVVAHVVGDDRRVTRVVLGDACLDLADEVGANIGGLREDAATEPGEHRDQRATEGQADQVVDRGLRRVVEPARQHPVVAGDAEQAETDDEQARHRAGAEGDVQCGCDTAASSLGGAEVRAHGDVHADEAGGRREDGADQEADRRAPAKHRGREDVVIDPEQHERHDRNHRDRLVLLLQICRGAFLNCLGDLLHALIALGLLHQPGNEINTVRDPYERRYEPTEHRVIFEEMH